MKENYFVKYLTSKFLYTELNKDNDIFISHTQGKNISKLTSVQYKMTKFELVTEMKNHCSARDLLNETSSLDQAQHASDYEPEVDQNASVVITPVHP